KAPRTLSAEQIERMAEKLKPFAGTVVDAGFGPMGDPEPLYLIRSIATVLSKAGWKLVDWTGPGFTYSEPLLPTLGQTLVTNVIVDVHPDRWAKFGAAATALAAALASEGIDAIAHSRPSSINTDAIHVRVGRKL